MSVDATVFDDLAPRVKSLPEVGWIAINQAQHLDEKRQNIKKQILELKEEQDYFISGLAFSWSDSELKNSGIEYSDEH